MDKMKNIYIIILLLITVNLKSQINCCTGLGQAVFVKYGCSAKLQISGATKAIFNLENTRITTVTSNYVTVNDGVNTATLNLQNLAPTYTIASIQDSIVKWHNECLSQSPTCLDPCTLPLPIEVTNDSLLVHVLNDSLDFEYKTYCYREKATGKRFDFNVMLNTKNPNAPTFMNLVDVEQLNEVFKADYINNVFVGTFPNISADYVSCEMFIDSVYVANQLPSIENDYEAICYKVGAGSIKQGFKRFVNTGLTTNLIEILDSANAIVVGAVQVPCNDTLCFEILDSTTYVKLVNYCDNGVNILKEYTYKANNIISSRYIDKNGAVFTVSGNEIIGECNNSLSVAVITPAYSSNRTLLTANSTPVAYNIPVPTNTREITIQNITGADISVATSQGSQIVGTRNSASISNPSNTTQLQSVFTGNVTVSFLSSVLGNISGVAPRVIINFKSY